MSSRRRRWAVALFALGTLLLVMAIFPGGRSVEPAQIAGSSNLPRQILIESGFASIAAGLLLLVLKRKSVRNG